MSMNIENVWQSAAKIVFISLSTTGCIAFLFSVFTGKTQFTTADFMILATAAFSFYFAKKDEGNIMK